MIVKLVFITDEDLIKQKNDSVFKRSKTFFDFFFVLAHQNRLQMLQTRSLTKLLKTVQK